MAFGWLKSMFGKKSKGGDSGQIQHVFENPLYEGADNEAVNPFFQEEEDTFTPWDGGTSRYSSVTPVRETSSPTVDTSAMSETRSEVIIEPGNQWEIIGGMPTRDSVNTGGIDKAAAEALDAMKALGFSKEEATELFLNNLAYSRDSDRKVTKEELDASEIGALLRDYD